MSLASLVASYTRTPTATCYLDGRRWYGVQKLRASQKFGESIAGGSVEGRSPPVTPRIGMAVRWTWGYNGQEVAGFSGEVSDVVDFSYPDRWAITCKDVLWRADKSSQVLQTDPLNEIAASDAVRYLLTHYGGISSSRISIPALPASGSAWAGSEWILGIQTPVQWGDLEQESGGTTALKAAAEICVCLGYWLYADSGGIIRAKQMERKPSQSARETFERNVNLLIQGAPERRQSYESIYNQATVRGANTGVEGAQLYDQFRTNHPLLPANVYRDFGFSSLLLEYENPSEAGAASVTSVAQRILNVVSRIPDVVPLRAKADPSRKVGDTVGIIDSGIQITTRRNFFIYQLDRELDLNAGRFDDSLTLDGGTGNSGFTTVPPPDASFIWTLMAETLDGTAAIEVFLDGSASSSPSGEIVDWDWSTSTPTYASTPNTATGVRATFVFALADSPALITLTVTDTTSKVSTFEASIDLTGADTTPPIEEVVSAAAGAAWYITPDGGATWQIETANGDATSVGTIGAGADDRAAGQGGTYGMLATRGSGGAEGLRQTLDALASASTNLVSNSGAITSNIWVNEANPARVWFAIGTAVYRSIDGGATKVAMAAAPGTVSWIMEDAVVENSVFLLSGADMLNATDPTVGWALLYAGPVGATARQFVRSRDGQVTWVCYSGAPAGESLQRVENGAAADWSASDCQTLALGREASSLLATVYGITADDPAQLWSFDGLTGLSAAQSSQTFPSGATVQHMLSSRQADVIYTADFDSVASGQGALRKYFPVADQLLLWKELASGQQGHMLGLGARVTSAASLILLPYGAAGAADKIFVFDAATSAWRSITPPAANYFWQWIAANPFDTNKWLLLGNNTTAGAPYFYAAVGGVMTTQDGAHSPVWRTDDAGATWVECVLPSPVPDASASGDTAILRVEWSAADGTLWYVARQDGVIGTSLWRGTGTTAASPVTDTTTTGYLSLLPGADGDVYFPPSAAAGNPHKGIYVSSTDVWTVPSGASLGIFDGQSVPHSDREPLSRRALMMIFDGSLYATPDYRSAQPTLVTTSSGFSVAIVGDAAYVGSGSGISRILDPFGTASASVVYAPATTTGVIRSDRQTHTHAAVYTFDGSGNVTAIGIFDGATWSTLAPPPDADLSAMADYIEVLVVV